MNTKSKLISSLLILTLCVTMFVGSTYAWFTDSAVSAGNKIVAGDLDVQLLMWDGSTYKDISETSAPIFGKEDSATANSNSADTLWEPGKTQVAYLKIVNNGSLDLKYIVELDVEDDADDKDMYKAMEYAIIPDAKDGVGVNNWTTGKTPIKGAQVVSEANVTLEADEEHYFALAVHMKEEAGNEYMNGYINFDIKVMAAQLASEADGFNNNYDVDAPYEASGVILAGASAEELTLYDSNGTKAGSVVVPAAAVDGSEIHAKVDKSTYEGNFTVATGHETKVYDITVDGLKDGNTEPLKVALYIGEQLNPATVEMYHYNAPIESTYNPHTGYVTFESATFSPFTIVYDAESVYIPPVADKEDLPVANVVNSPEYENVDLPWGSYDVWSPTEGLDSQLEAAYTFSCAEDLDKAMANPYANWYCDFYVKLDKDLGANQIFLGGYYGSFKWVGFHNGDMTLEANTEIPLLGSVVSNEWTYLDVVQNVGTFICGVGDVDNALEGATFTVMLRLTNPEDESEFYNVATITHKFTGTTDSEE